jgi:hypothetical protein
LRALTCTHVHINSAETQFKRFRVGFRRCITSASTCLRPGEATIGLPISLLDPRCTHAHTQNTHTRHTKKTHRLADTHMPSLTNSRQDHTFHLSPPSPPPLSLSLSLSTQSPLCPPPPYLSFSLSLSLTHSLSRHSLLSRARSLSHTRSLSLQLQLQLFLSPTRVHTYAVLCSLSGFSLLVFLLAWSKVAGIGEKNQFCFFQ